MALSSAQVSIIRSTVPVLQDHGNAITKSFYSALLKEVPELNSVFNHANQANNHQAPALAKALHAYAAHIDDLDLLKPAVEKICQKHASLYFQPDQYKIVGDYLLRAMGDVLGDALTPDMLDAWGKPYWQLADLMIAREEQILQNDDGWTDWRAFRIQCKIVESDQITSFYLIPIDGNSLPGLLPGQYISIMTNVPKLRYQQARQYSVSDQPKPGYYRISAKREDGLDTTQCGAERHPGYVSNILHLRKQVSDTLLVSHPAGDFYADPVKMSGPVVLPSAGVGITPIISIVNMLVQTKYREAIRILHGARTICSLAFAEHISHLVEEHDNISSAIFIKEACGGSDARGYHFNSRLSLEALDAEQHLCLNDTQTPYFVCGPQSFMEQMLSGLLERGVDDSRIRMELFGTRSIPH